MHKINCCGICLVGYCYNISVQLKALSLIPLITILLWSYKYGPGQKCIIKRKHNVIFKFYEKCDISITSNLMRAFGCKIMPLII